MKNLGYIYEDAVNATKHALAKGGWMRPPMEYVDHLNVKIANRTDYDDVMRWWQNQQLSNSDDYLRVLSDFNPKFAYNALQAAKYDCDLGAITEYFVTPAYVDVAEPTLTYGIKQAITLMIMDICRKEKLSVDMLTYYHATLCKSAVNNNIVGVFRNHKVENGSNPALIRGDIKKAIRQAYQFIDFNDTKNYILAMAAYIGCAIGEISPFEVYNGIMAKLFINYILMMYGLPPVVIPAGENELFLEKIRRCAETEDVIDMVYYLRICAINTWGYIFGWDSNTTFREL